MSKIPRGGIVDNLRGDTGALGSTWAFSAHLDVRSINASSCVLVCTQMQASFMLITS